MSADWATVAASVSGLAGAAALVWGAMTTWRKATSDRHSAAEQRLDARLDVLNQRVNAAAVRERVRDDYIFLLRQHIADGQPPPPPPWPAQLTSID